MQDNPRLSKHIDSQYEITRQVMTKSLHKMWLVIVCEAVINFYSYIESQVIYFTPAGSNCHFFDHYAYNWNTVTNRLITLVVWTWPIVYIFWPSSHTWYCKKLTKA